MTSISTIARSPQLIGGVIALWGFGTAAAFWSMEARYLRPVPRPRGAAVAHPDLRPAPPIAALTTTAGVAALGAPGKVTVLNFWNAHCPCSRYMEPHVAGLQKRYAASGVRFITIVEGEAGVDTAGELLAAWRARGGGEAAADPDGRIARAFGVWAAPGAAIMDRSGRVAYVGGYNAARFCDDARTAWAAQALDAVSRGVRPARTHTLFFGCQVLAQAR